MAAMTLKNFFESYPLYRKFPQDVPLHFDRMEQLSINSDCDRCSGIQTLVQSSPWAMLATHANSSTTGQVIYVKFKCVGCGITRRHFLLKVSDKNDWVMKVGQWPAWSIELDRGISDMVGEHATEFRKGLTCESQGYGIGAFAYFRRIVETMIDKLLDEISEIIPIEEQPAYSNALQAAKKTIVAQEKIAIVKELLPSTLRPGGINPLAVLHSVLSEGIHSRTDEQCLEDAALIRESLSFLVIQLLQAKESARSFTANMQRLLEKKARSAE
jgi:hypothetical protein